MNFTIISDQKNCHTFYNKLGTREIFQEEQLVILSTTLSKWQVHVENAS